MDTWKGGLVLFAALCATVVSVLWTVTRPPAIPHELPPLRPPVRAYPPEIARRAREVDMGAPLPQLVPRLAALTKALREQPDARFSFPNVSPWNLDNLATPLQRAKSDELGPQFLAHFLLLTEAQVGAEGPPWMVTQFQVIAGLAELLETGLDSYTLSQLKSVQVELQHVGWLRFRLDDLEGPMQDLDPQHLIGDVKPRDSRAPYADRIRRLHRRLLAQGDWAGYHNRAVAVRGWQQSAEGTPFRFVCAALHPGWAQAALDEEFAPDDFLMSVILAQARLDALPVRISREIAKRTHAGKPAEWPADPFAPGRPLMLRQGELWSVGPDGVEDGHVGAGVHDFGYRGDIKL